MKSRNFMLIAAILCVAAPARAQQPTANPAQASAILPSYRDAEKGLKEEIDAILSEKRSGDDVAFNAHVTSMILPDAATWFVSIFGDEQGRAFAARYALLAPRLDAMLAHTFAGMASENAKDIEANRFENACDSHVTYTALPVLALRKKSAPLYQVRYSFGNQLNAIWAFAFVDGHFRYLGDLHAGLGDPHAGVDDADSGAKQGRIRVGGNVQRAKMLRMVQPKYPEDAKFNHIQGTVLLLVTIGKDGAIHMLEFKDGPCVLAVPAIQAVIQWRYSPTLLRGDPVEVDTTISVVFNLRE